jgi:hypothetical protein
LQKQVAAVGILLAILIGIPSAFAFYGRTDSANVFYVSITGSDSSDGSFNAPWRTVQHALDMLQPGQTVFVRAGTYNEFIEFQRSGNAGAPIVLSGYPGETAVLDGTGLNWRYGVNLQSFDNLVVENLNIRDYIRDGERGFGIVGWGDTDNIVLRNLSISLVGTPIKIAADGGTEVRSNITIEDIIAAEYDWGGIDLGPGPVSNVIVRNVQLMGQPGGDNTAIDGIAVEDGNQIIVEGAIIRGHAGDGVDLKADNVAVRQVDARGYSRNGLKLWGANAIAENNLFLGGELESLVLKGGPCMVRNNLFSTAPGHGYTAVIGPYEPSPGTSTASITMLGNIFYNPENTGTLIYFSPVVALDANYNLYYSPQRTDAVLEAYLGGVARTFSAAEINDGTWASAMGTDQQSKYEDPLLVNPGAGDYQLQAGSPAIDAMPAALAPPTDLLGTARPQGSGADIGPYEFMNSYDFSLSNSSGVTVVQGGSGSNTITTTLLGGSSQPVSLSCTSGIPMGASCSFNPSSGNPTFVSALTISTSSSTPTDCYQITVTGTAGSLSHTTQFQLTVTGAQVVMTVSYSIVGGGTPTAPVFHYVLSGATESLTLSKTSKSVSVDWGTSWSVTPNPLSRSTSSQRWYSNQPLTGTASSTTLVFTFYRQTLQTLSYSVSGGDSGYSPPTFQANQFGSPIAIPLTNTPTGYWFDYGSRWTVTNPLGGSSSSERWFTTQATAGSIGSSSTRAFKFQHQYYLTMQVSPSGAGYVVPSSCWLNSGQRVTIRPVARTGHRFLSWTGTGTGSYTGTSASATITMSSPITEIANFS